MFSLITPIIYHASLLNLMVEITENRKTYKLEKMSSKDFRPWEVSLSRFGCETLCVAIDY